MRPPRSGTVIVRGTAILAAVLAMTTGARAETVDVPPGETTLRAAIEAARPADVLRLTAGEYGGPVVVDRPLTLVGDPGAVVRGSGNGSVIRVVAADVAIRGLGVTGSGSTLNELDAGIYLDKQADRAVVENNSISGNLYGVVLQGPQNPVVRGNRITNRNDLWLNYRGDGISLWRSSGATIADNRVEGGRDGILVNIANGNVIRGNRFSGLRFAVHYMYANNNDVSDNISIGNHVGYALMYSEKIKVMRNVSLDDDQHGILLHTSYRSEVAYNYVKGTKDKCTFVYTSAQSTIHDNRFEGCGIGVHYAGGAQDNLFHGNAFIDNGTQVRFAGTTLYDWSKDGRGNYWSDNPAFDLDGDGVADIPYRPNDVIDRVIWAYPLAKLLLSSPAVETLRFVQRQMPALYPGGVVDTRPMMTAPAPPIPLPTSGKTS